MGWGGAMHWLGKTASIARMPVPALHREVISLLVKRREETAWRRGMAWRARVCVLSKYWSHTPPSRAHRLVSARPTDESAKQIVSMFFFFFSRGGGGRIAIFTVKVEIGSYLGY